MQFPTTITGEVIHGKALGRQLGFRTANMELDPNLGVDDGTYQVEGLVRGILQKGLGVYKIRDGIFETHFLDFDDDIYGEIIEITILSKIRDNIKFESLDALKAQIQKDIESVSDPL